MFFFVSRLLEEKAKSITGIHQWPFRALARAFEVIPRTLIQNCGANVIRTLTALRSKHSQDGNSSWGVDGDNGNLVDMKDLGIWEPLAVKQQTYKTAIEVCWWCLPICLIYTIGFIFGFYFRPLFCFWESMTLSLAPRKHQRSTVNKIHQAQSHRKKKKKKHHEKNRTDDGRQVLVGEWKFPEIFRNSFNLFDNNSYMHLLHFTVIVCFGNK
jgi:hypothetical protein